MSALVMPSLHSERGRVPAAPVAVAAECEYGSDADVLAIDVEAEAKAAYERRRADELEYQVGLESFAGGSA
ncbi:MAG: hypothetical protein ACQEP0_16305 [Natrinema limicola]|uniref:Uncharacterized protein n=2 Tax=Natrinema limicola TaxID=370323 RepID=M0BXI3_9EURY|nr:hypothetical protein C476_17997 [Natrinema limicola JCM 13563]